ncbi:MAG TPA: O-antigen ligase family protein [Polyangia bacterium]
MAIPLLFMRTSPRTPDSYSLPKELILHAIAMVAGVVTVLRTRSRGRAVEACIALGLVVSVISAVFAAQNPWWAVRAVGLTWSIGLVFWCSRQLRSDRARGFVMASAMLGVLALAVLVLLEAHGLIPTISMSGRAPGGPGGNRNFTAHLLVLSLPLLFVALLTESSRARRALAAVAFSAALAAVVVSRCRGAWMATLATGVVIVITMILFRVKATPTRYLLAAFVIFVGTLLGGISTRTHAGQVGPSGDASLADTLVRIGDYQTGTGRGRLIQYRTTLAMIAERPWFGVGPGNWSVGYPAHAGPEDPSFNAAAAQPVNRLPSSDLLGLVAERGLLFGVIVMAGLFAFLWDIAHRLRGPGVSRAPVVVAIGTASAALAMGLVDAVVMRVEPAFFVAVVLGLLVPARETLQPTRNSSRFAQIAAASSVVVVGAALGLQAFASARALRLAERNTARALAAAFQLDPGNFVLAGRAALRHAALGKCEEARALASVAKRYQPRAPDATEALSVCAQTLRGDVAR